MAASTRARVSSLTLDSPLTTRETVFSPTPASAATSRIVAGRTSGDCRDNVFSSTTGHHRCRLRDRQVSRIAGLYGIDPRPPLRDQLVFPKELADGERIQHAQSHLGHS